MLIAFASMTGNVRRFIKKLGLQSVHIQKDTIVEEPFVLVTYTTGKGQTPKEVTAFLENNHQLMMAVVGSGNRNWGDSFCGGAVTVAKQYAIPLLHTFEMSGFKKDVETVLSKIEELEKG